MNRKDLLFVVITENDEKFGMYIKTPITFDNRYASDKNNFLFKLKQEENHRFGSSERIDLEYLNSSIKLSQNKEKELFIIGDYKIVFMKENGKDQSYYSNKLLKIQTNINQKDESVIFFYPKHIMVIQLTQSSIMQQINTKENEEMNLTPFEQHQKQLESLLEMKIDETIFDIQKYDWNIGASTFDSVVLNKRQLAFIIQDTNENIFGCYIDATIDNHVYLVEKEWKGKMISDSKSSVFSLYSNGRLDKPMKFIVKEGYEEWSFQLYQKEWGALFAVGGGNDIYVKKSEVKEECFYIQLSFDYEGIENALIGKTVYHSFTVKNILVIQFM